MENKYLAISNGTFTLTESENKNEFYFYRNDGGVLIDIGNEPLDLYRAYVIQKMMKGEITYIVMNDIYTEISDDAKIIRVVIYETVGKKQNNKSDGSDKKQNFFKRLFHKFFW